MRTHNLFSTMKTVAVIFCAASACLSVVSITGCDSRGDEVVAATPLPADTPDHFLRYLNTQTSLVAGSYTIVAATNNTAETGAYTLDVTRDDGSVQHISGNWTSSGGQSATAAGNPTHVITLANAGGLKIAMTSAVDGYLYLVRNGVTLAEADAGGTNGNPLIDLPLTKISSDAYGAAYYLAADPNSERATFTDFLKRNCFTNGPNCAGETVGDQVHVVFRDSKDLGYGRNMHMRRNNDGSLAFYVDNYVIKLQNGGSSNYGPINVEAAVRDDRRHFRGTNAIEFSPIDPLNPSSEKITRFFTYSTSGTRITSADLDGRGVKSMPGMCWACHGGRTLPLDSTGQFPLMSLRSAKLNPLEPDSFEFSTLAGFSRTEQEAGFRTINSYVRDSYLAMQARDVTNPGKWFGDYAASLVEGHYGGAALPSLAYQADFVPPGWRRDPAIPATMLRPEGVEDLYKRVIGPNCAGCHMLQGHNAAEVEANNGSAPMANAINFSSWEKFFSYRAIVADYVFRRGVMPLSLRNYEQFWKNPQDKPALLAAFLQDSSLFDANGNVIPPGKPIARPGMDRTASSPVELDGTASSFARSYQWQIVSGPAGAAFSSVNSATPVFTTTSAGTYVVSLTVSNTRGTSAAVNQTITIDNTISNTPTFTNDIMPILGSNTGNNCTVCHSSGSGYDGIPVIYAASNPNLYRDVLARVNLEDPEMSLLLRKPTGPRHGGGLQTGLVDLQTVNGKKNVATILNWIRAGAPQ